MLKKLGKQQERMKHQEHPYNVCLNFSIYFRIKTYFFLFYKIMFTKHPHQIIYYTFHFNQYSYLFHLKKIFYLKSLFHMFLLTIKFLFSLLLTLSSLSSLRSLFLSRSPLNHQSLSRPLNPQLSFSSQISLILAFFVANKIALVEASDT